VQLEYFDDPSIARPVLLTYSKDPSDAAALQRALAPLVAGDTDRQVQIDKLPGFRGSNLGVTRTIDNEPSFSCALNPTTWSQVSGLLEPFTQARAPRAPDVHQYLASDGPIDWIVATSRHW